MAQILTSIGTFLGTICRLIWGAITLIWSIVLLIAHLVLPPIICWVVVGSVCYFILRENLDDSNKIGFIASVTLIGLYYLGILSEGPNE